MAHNSTYQNQDVWFLDSRASNHMTGRKDLFTELNKKVQGEISFDDLSKISVQGRRDVMIKQKNGDHAFISNVYYVPDMKTDILSLGQLLEKGYHISLQNMQLTITDARGKLVTRVQMTKNRMFPLTIHHDTPKCLTAIINNKNWLWHLRTIGYWLYNPITKKVIFSRDVIFEENESWNWNQAKASRSAELIPEEETKEVAIEPQTPKDQQTHQRGSPSPQRYDTPLPIDRDFSDMRPRGTRSLEDLYEDREHVEEDLTLYCLLMTNDPVSFKEANQEEK
ncbi:hypothetical protein LWI28_000828 [Acer negundo]|uniref:Uncharacterized protein n=1 Tax=Acer negundo TaxID=4023 RepID=A0AAD5NTF0_ACENE|nr:hypothetical protein LWI28_000828 [Acer negundo]